MTFEMDDMPPVTVSILTSCPCPLSVTWRRLQRLSGRISVTGFAQDFSQVRQLQASVLLPALQVAESTCLRQAHVKAARQGTERPVRTIYSLESLGPQAPLSLPSPSYTCSSAANLHGMRQDPELSKDLKDRVSNLLAAEFSRKVWAEQC